MTTAIEFNNISKQYRLGLVSTRTISHDLNRWWQTSVLHKEDPYLKIGSINDRSKAADSEYVWALKDIDFKVEQGDVVGIIGKNGAGKSTLLKLLSRVTGPTTGTIRARGRIGSLLEVGTGFHPEMTGRENIYMNGSILGMNKAEITRKLDEIVDFSGCERYIDTPVKRYSSGMMVRLGFAVAAHLDPEILVVDEVLAVGDAEFQKKAIGKMQDVSRGEGRTVLFVSHNMASMKALCRRGILLENGAIRFDGSMGDAIELYLKGNEYNEDGTILSNVKCLSSEISITKVLINGKANRIMNMPFPNRKLDVEVEGELLNDIHMSIEAKLFDSESVLLAKFAPVLMKTDVPKVTKGKFKLTETINLPDNMTNGEYRLQLEVSHPNVQYLAVIPDAAKLVLSDYITPTGNSLMYNQNGMLLLQ
jgi:lipopolysaccharide transport system ATP-binding protein